jgi:hypothetical protein
MTSKIIFIYSKFCSYCRDIQNLMAGIIETRNVCIDNSKIREEVLKDRTLNIQTVPCIIVVYPEGKAEKYEGNDAFELVEKQRSQFLMLQQQEQQKIQMQAQQQAQMIIEEKMRADSLAQQEQVPTEDEELDRRMKKNTRRKKKKQQQTYPSLKEEISSEVEDEDEISNNKKGSATMDKAAELRQARERDEEVITVKRRGG